MLRQEWEGVYSSYWENQISIADLSLSKSFPGVFRHGVIQANRFQVANVAGLFETDYFHKLGIA
jgi:hypothetical protein